MDELTTELHEYATLDSLYPLLTSSREGIMFQNEYRSNRTTENNKTLFSIVPYGKCTYRHMSDDDISGEGTGLGGDDVPYEIDSYLTEINTGVIDANYMNSRFSKYLKALQDGTETAAVLDELHKSFATLTQEEQKYANI